MSVQLLAIGCQSEEISRLAVDASRAIDRRHSIGMSKQRVYLSWRPNTNSLKPHLQQQRRRWWPSGGGGDSIVLATLGA